MGNPGTAAVLSFIFNGLGQLYNGQLKKGLWIIFLSTLTLITSVIGAGFIFFWIFAKARIQFLYWGAFIFIISILFTCIVGIYSIFDAYKSAQQN